MLIVDEHAVKRRGPRAVLERIPDMGVVTEAEGGIEGVRLAVEHRPDVAVVDVSIPGTGSPAVTKLIRERCPEVAVLALTMHDDRDHPAGGDSPEGGARFPGVPQFQGGRGASPCRMGHGNQDIGNKLDISPRTVETCRVRIAGELGLQTRPAIVRYAVLRGWLGPD